MFHEHPTWEVRRARSPFLQALMDRPRHSTYTQHKVGDRLEARFPLQAPTTHGLRRPPRPGLSPSSGVFRGLLSPTAAHSSSPTFKANSPRNPALCWPQWVPLSKRLFGLTPAPKQQDSKLGEGSALSPPQPGPAACGAGAPLNVTYCLRGGFRKCQAPIKQPCSSGKTKKGLFIWDLFPLSPFPISSGLAMV